MQQNQYRLLEFHPFCKGSVECIINQTYVPSTVIEIGLYQGYFTFNMTDALAPNDASYKHYAIDPYTGSQDLDYDLIRDAYNTFQNNLSICKNRNAIEFINKSSTAGLLELIGRGVKADLIYIDGDHKSDQVLTDLVLSFELLKTGGTILCDDSQSWCYTDKNREKAVQYSPRLAVDSFIHCHWGNIEVINLPNGYQTAFIKRCK